MRMVQKKMGMEGCRVGVFSIRFVPMSRVRIWITRILGALVIALIGGLVAGLLLTVSPPTMKIVRWRDAGIELRGTTSPKFVVVVFNEEHQEIAMANANAQGDFWFDGLAVPSGTRTLVIRVLDGGWRSSPPARIHLSDQQASDDMFFGGSTDTDGNDELPPLAIPPRAADAPRSASSTASSATSSTTGASTTTTSTIQRLILTPTLSSPTPTRGSWETLFVRIQDEQGKTITGASVRAVVHDGTGDIALTLRKSRNGYSVSFLIPTTTQPGVSSVIDMKAEFQGLVATARTMFVPQ